ncbi:hypothetical protein E2C01_048645 [Portunus trituberculatus]|uniref:Uncharacterized protein n=1 Tax=Portunus trituberculatus TaxID=210409 RepID=A0A5B7G3M3_PORTR|nr:hypothetical protein [Portunus trituberculatus]
MELGIALYRWVSLGIVSCRVVSCRVVVFGGQRDRDLHYRGNIFSGGGAEHDRLLQETNEPPSGSVAALGHDIRDAIYPTPTPCRPLPSPAFMLSSVHLPCHLLYVNLLSSFFFVYFDLFIQNPAFPCHPLPSYCYPLSIYPVNSCMLTSSHLFFVFLSIYLKPSLTLPYPALPCLPFVTLCPFILSPPSLSVC